MPVIFFLTQHHSFSGRMTGKTKWQFHISVDLEFGVWRWEEQWPEIRQVREASSRSRGAFCACTLYRKLQKQLGQCPSLSSLAALASAAHIFKWKDTEKTSKAPALRRYPNSWIARQQGGEWVWGKQTRRRELQPRKFRLSGEGDAFELFWRSRSHRTGWLQGSCLDVQWLWNTENR